MGWDSSGCFTSLVARARVARGSGGDGVGSWRGACHFFEGARVGLGRRVVGSARGEARAVARRLEARVDLCGRTLSGLGFQWLLHLARRAGACRERVGRRWCRRGARRVSGRRVVGSARGEARAVARRLEARVDLCGRTLSGLGFQWLLHLARRAGACRERVGRRWCRQWRGACHCFEGARLAWVGGSWARRAERRARSHGGWRRVSTYVVAR